jgi:hypothetical protein
MDRLDVGQQVHVAPPAVPSFVRCRGAETGLGCQRLVSSNGSPSLAGISDQWLDASGSTETRALPPLLL